MVSVRSLQRALAVPLHQATCPRMEIRMRKLRTGDGKSIVFSIGGRSVALISELDLQLRFLFTRFMITSKIRKHNQKRHCIYSEAYKSCRLFYHSYSIWLRFLTTGTVKHASPVVSRQVELTVCFHASKSRNIPFPFPLSCHFPILDLVPTHPKTFVSWLPKVCDPRSPWRSAR